MNENLIDALNQAVTSIANIDWVSIFGGMEKVATRIIRNLSEIAKVE